MDEKKAGENSELISMRGNRDLWLDFTHKIRKKKLKVWDVLQPMIKEYLKEEES